MTSKTEIVSKLHELADFRLMGEGPWLADRDFVSTFSALVRRFGLEEDCPDQMGTTRSTSLGRLVNLDQMMVFIGVFDVFDIPYLLESWGYIERETFDEIFASLDAEKAEETIRKYVREAYLLYCSKTSRAN